MYPLHLLILTNLSVLQFLKSQLYCLQGTKTSFHTGHVMVSVYKQETKRSQHSIVLDWLMRRPVGNITGLLARWKNTAIFTSKNTSKYMIIFMAVFFDVGIYWAVLLAVMVFLLARFELQLELFNRPLLLTCPFLLLLLLLLLRFFVTQHRRCGWPKNYYSFCTFSFSANIN